MIYTFYSFKGGAGRSMALANIAELLYRRGLKVLMVDFDLEAPGLAGYFDVPEAVNKLSDVLGKRGVIDMLFSYKRLRSLPRPAPLQENTTEALESQGTFPFPVEPLSAFIVPIYRQNADGGALSIIPAGCRAADEFTRYAKRVRSFDWDDFYANWDGEQFFDWLRREMEAVADVVLIDSRTGVTEMSGVCTYLLADVVVMFVTPNQQSLNGTLMMARSLSNPKLVQEGRKGRSLSLLFVPSRVEASEAALLDDFARRFNSTLTSFIAPELEFEKNAFMDLMIPYVPYYAYMENVPVRDPERASATFLIKAYQGLTSTLAGLAPEIDPMSKLLYGDVDTPMFNPFFYGNPVPPDQFIDRRRELTRIVGRIAGQGQSTAIVGGSRSGKTSLLLYLSAPEKRAELYGESGERLVFSYLDAQTFEGEFSQAQFWEHALLPLYEWVIAPNPESPLAQAYGVCQENEFGAFVLEHLFARMVPTGWRLVLMLDEFGVLLNHPILNSAEFFGSLRSLASRRQTLALVIASRRALVDLDKDTQRFSRAGSPYFNILSEVVLGPLPSEYIAELLRRGGDRFTADDRRFITEAAGGHPYLLQAGASALWDVSVEGQRNRNRQWQQVGQRLYDEAARTLSEIWYVWPAAARKAFTVVAMVDIPRMLKQHEFFVLPLLRDLGDLGPELRSLKWQGFVAEDESTPAGWRVRPQVFLWWLADELVRTVRHETSFEEWLRKQELGLLLTQGERELLGKAVLAVLGLLKGGAETLIKATVEGLVAGMEK